MTYATVLTTEAAWFALAGAPAGAMPALTVAAGGPFDIVASHTRRLAQRRHQLYLAHGTTRPARGAKDSVRLDHEVMAVVLWAATGAGGREHIDQEALEAAVAKVVARVIGPAGDVDHGGRWFSVGRPMVEPEDPLSRLRFADAITAAGAAHTVIVRYRVSEYVAR